jgi:hypothetical protein
MQAICIEQNDEKSHVMHEVRNTFDGKEYVIKLSAECPITAMKIASAVPLTYWEEVK